MILLHDNIFTQGLKVDNCILRFEPVDVVCGRVLYYGSDFSLPGPLPLIWKRVWYSDRTQFSGITNWNEND